MAGPLRTSFRRLVGRSRDRVRRRRPAELWGNGALEISYAPRADGRADPGEVVWTWVPYEEDSSQGKDRPVLIIGRRADSPDWLVGLMLTSKDHDRETANEARRGRNWMDVGWGDGTGSAGPARCGSTG